MKFSPKELRPTANYDVQVSESFYLPCARKAKNQKNRTNNSTNQTSSIQTANRYNKKENLHRPPEIAYFFSKSGRDTMLSMYHEQKVFNFEPFFPIIRGKGNNTDILLFLLYIGILIRRENL